MKHRVLTNISAHEFRSVVCRVVGFWLALSLVTTAAGSPAKKKLTIENIMELLSGGVSIHRVTYLVAERGIDFQLTPRLEQAFFDAGADQGLILALHGQPVAPITIRAPEAAAETPRKYEASAPHSEGPNPPKLSPPATLGTSTSGQTESAGLQIRSRPGGASIFVDEELKGMTDPEDGHLEISALKPGKHRLRATHGGYQEVEGTVELAPGQMLETPIWMAKSEATATPPPSAPSLPPGKKFLVRHKHMALAGMGSGRYCQGWIVVSVGYVRYVSTDSPHTYLMNTSEMREAKASGGPGGFLIKLDFGRKYEFVAMDDKGKEVSPGPILSEIRYSRGE